MHRPSDGIIWAATAAAAFGLVVTWLLDGSEPLLVVTALVILVGASVVLLLGRRRAAWQRATRPAPRADERRWAPRAEQPRPLPSTPTAPPRAPARAATTTATGIPTGPEARRAGARGASLGDRKPPPGTDSD